MSAYRCCWLDLLPTRSWVPGALPAEKIEESELRKMLDEPGRLEPHLLIPTLLGHCELCGGIGSDPVHIAAKYAVRVRQLLADKWELTCSLKQARDERNLLAFQAQWGAK